MMEYLPLTDSNLPSMDMYYVLPAGLTINPKTEELYFVQSSNFSSPFFHKVQYLSEQNMINFVWTIDTDL